MLTKGQKLPSTCRKLVVLKGQIKGRGKKMLDKSKKKKKKQKASKKLK